MNFVTNEKSLILQAEKFYRIPAGGMIFQKINSCHNGSMMQIIKLFMDIDWELISEKESEWDEEMGCRN